MLLFYGELRTKYLFGIAISLINADVAANPKLHTQFCLNQELRRLSMANF